jgi:hypothetical protein
MSLHEKKELFSWLKTFLINIRIRAQIPGQQHILFVAHFSFHTHNNTTYRVARKYLYDKNFEYLHLGSTS